MEENYIRRSSYMKRKELNLAIDRLGQSFYKDTWIGKLCVLLVDNLSKLLDPKKRPDN